MKNTEKTMDKIVALCKTAALFSPGLRSTVASPTPGTTAPWVWS